MSMSVSFCISSSVKTPVLPQIIVNSYLDAHAAALGTLDILIHLHSPPIPRQMLPRLNDHVTHQLSLIHQRSAKRLGAGPRLRTSAVEIHARYERRNEGRGAGEFLGDVGAELDNGGRLDARGRDGEVCSLFLLALVLGFILFGVSDNDKAYRCLWQTDSC